MFTCVASTLSEFNSMNSYVFIHNVQPHKCARTPSKPSCKALAEFSRIKDGGARRHCAVQPMPACTTQGLDNAPPDSVQQHRRRRAPVTIDDTGITSHAIDGTTLKNVYTSSSNDCTPISVSQTSHSTEKYLSVSSARSDGAAPSPPPLPCFPRRLSPRCCFAAGRIVVVVSTLHSERNDS